MIGFRNKVAGDELSIITYYFFERHNLFDLLNIDVSTFVAFINKIQSGYFPNPYHNANHAADVVQTSNYLAVKGNLFERAELNNLEVAALYLSAAVHDYEHPGHNNLFQINSGGLYAIRYNDKEYWKTIISVQPLLS